jgi:periplasmic divalent cation tolerance protein
MAATRDACVVLVTCPSGEEADAMARGLVERRLAAGVQIIAVSSIYTWKGRVRNRPEHLLVIKTGTGRYPDLERFVREHHPYDVPQILQIPVQAGLEDYLQWIDASTGDGEP